MNKEEKKEYNREYMRRWRLEHPEEAKERGKRWYLEHTEEAKEASKQWRLEHPEYYRQWYLEHTEEAKEHNRQWYLEHTEEAKEYHRQYRLKKPEVKYAQNVINNSIALGKLIRQPCSVCGKPKADAHHPDYNKPKDVIWLCHSHHKQLEADMKKGKWFDKMNQINWLENVTKKSKIHEGAKRKDAKDTIQK